MPRLCVPSRARGSARPIIVLAVLLLVPALARPQGAAPPGPGSEAPSKSAGDAAQSDAQEYSRSAKGHADETASPLGLPAIGFWMLSPKGEIADWLGAPFEGKRLLEPVNILIVDRYAKSEAEAGARLLKACGAAEFPQREGHSNGYSALLGDARRPQFPPGEADAFSDAIFILNNDHGRIFGPIAWKGAYVFAGAFSRESVDPVTKVKHRYVSFDRARDAFALRMSERGGYEIGGYVELGNAIVGSGDLSTGDHDGVAVLLSAKP